MRIVNKKEPILLGIGDVAILFASLIIALIIRYQAFPSAALVNSHLAPFGIIFLYSIILFYISGLYGRIIAPSRSIIPGLIIRAQVVNGLIAVALFYFVKEFDVTPKANLFIYLGISTVGLIIWRFIGHKSLAIRQKSPAIVIGAGSDVEELVQEMRHNPRLGLYCKDRIDPSVNHEAIVRALEGDGSAFHYIVADIDDPAFAQIIPELYRRFFPNAQVIDVHDLYEEVFSRVPLSRMNHAWAMTRVSGSSPRAFDLMKRIIDIFFGLIVGFFACILYPFVALAIKLETKGPVFISQERVGKNNKPIHVYKFRSMERNELAKWVPEDVAGGNRVTRVGHFIRATRIDELPQALAILKGDMSLIGPRPDVVGLGMRLEKEIPYYAVRTAVTPGLSGWAQINQEKPPQSVAETMVRLSYDLYYIQHRSLGLDFQIALRTLKTLASRVGM